MPNLVVSLHDVSPLTQDSCTRMLEQLAGLGVSQTSLLVVPNYHRKAPVGDHRPFQQWLSLQVAAGHEAVLHGYFHRRLSKPGDSPLVKFTTEFYTAGEAEFYDLPRDEALELLRRGLVDLGFLPRRITGFVAPAWLLGTEAREAVRLAGFRYTTSIGGVRVFKDDRLISSRSLVWSTRSTWRQIVSLGWNRSLAGLMRGAGLLRIGIHQPDYRVGSVWAQIKSLIARVLETRTAVSYERFVERVSECR
ncbi:MAG: polysaccharide deacetylase family protein [Chthoniobacterales bacterium]